MAVPHAARMLFHVMLYKTNVHMYCRLDLQSVTQFTGRLECCENVIKTEQNH